MRADADYDGQGAVVIGGLGPLGAATVRRLSDLGGRVTVIDAASSPHADLGRLAGYEQRVDLRLVEPDREGFPPDVLRNALAVFHVPPVPAHDPWVIPTRSEERVRLAALAVLQTALDVNPASRLVLASTRRVYGRPAQQPVPDDAPCHPLTLLGVERLATEASYRAFAQVHDLPVTILRLTTVYALDGDRPWAALPDRFLARARAGGRIVVYAEDVAADDYLHADDAVTALVRAGSAPAARGATLNVGAGRSWLPREVAELAVAVAGRGGVEVRPGRPAFEAEAAFQADVARGRHLLDLPEPASLEDGLRRSMERA